MKSQIPTATKIIDAPADTIYNIIADYRSMHWLILPKEYFLSLDVEQGGFGAGTIINFEMRILGQTRSFRSLITEPEPGRVLVETDINTKVATSFQVIPMDDGQQSRVTISTELKTGTIVEKFIAKWILQKIYRQELDLLTRVAEEQVKLKRSSGGNKERSVS